jgi:hypothetical protein
MFLRCCLGSARIGYEFNIVVIFECSQSGLKFQNSSRIESGLNLGIFVPRTLYVSGEFLYSLFLRVVRRFFETIQKRLQQSERLME